MDAAAKGIGAISIMNEAGKTTILVTDDEIQIRRLLRACLEMSGYGMIEAATGQAGIEEAARNQPDIVLSDMGLPDMDGLSVIKRMREWSQTPMLIVSVRDEDNKIAAQDNGANDYITKPFGTGELLARIRVLMRAGQPRPNMEVFHSGPLSVDPVARSVKVGGRAVRLTAAEYSPPILLVQHAGKVLTHGQLPREIWGVTEAEKTGPLRVYVGYLRHKIETNPAKPELLITEPGAGYRLVVQE